MALRAVVEGEAVVDFCNSRWKGIVSGTAAVAVSCIPIYKQPVAAVLALCKTP